MKKIFLAAMMLFAIAGVTQAQTPAAKTQKKEAIKPASSVTTVAPAKKSATSTKPSTTASTQKVNAANIGKHKKAHHKAAKKPAKKS